MPCRHWIYGTTTITALRFAVAAGPIILWHTSEWLSQCWHVTSSVSFCSCSCDAASRLLLVTVIYSSVWGIIKLASRSTRPVGECVFEVVFQGSALPEDVKVLAHATNPIDKLLGSCGME